MPSATSYQSPPPPARPSLKSHVSSAISVSSVVETGNGWPATPPTYRMPKLTYRNQSEPSEISGVPRKDTDVIEEQAAQDAVSLATRVTISGSRPARDEPQRGVRSLGRMGSLTTGSGRPFKTKTSSIMSFFSTKEPSAVALAQLEAEQRRMMGVSKNSREIPLGVSTAKLPPEVPKVNSKWDGVTKDWEENGRPKPGRSSKERAGRSSAGSHSRPSTARSKKVRQHVSGSSEHVGSSVKPRTPRPSLSSIAVGKEVRSGVHTGNHSKSTSSVSSSTPKREDTPSIVSSSNTDDTAHVSKGSTRRRRWSKSLFPSAASYQESITTPGSGPELVPQQRPPSNISLKDENPYFSSDIPAEYISTGSPAPPPRTELPPTPASLPSPTKPVQPPTPLSNPALRDLRRRSIRKRDSLKRNSLKHTSLSRPTSLAYSTTDDSYNDDDDDEGEDTYDDESILDLDRFPSPPTTAGVGASISPISPISISPTSFPSFPTSGGLTLNTTPSQIDLHLFEKSLPAAINPTPPLPLLPPEERATEPRVRNRSVAPWEEPEDVVEWDMPRIVEGRQGRGGDVLGSGIGVGKGMGMGVGMGKGVGGSVGKRKSRYALFLKS
ncbi:MAG: hypothetical protein M1824_002934 [Vezdaea acicularis]|nr:MAG: hypothetical protein M1824_002934 [Vezdaea acicularis]